MCTDRYTMEMASNIVLFKYPYIILCLIQDSQIKVVIEFKTPMFKIQDISQNIHKDQ